MSGIDEVGMKSCGCVDDRPDRNNQYWLVKDILGGKIGYYNPDAFRTANKDREDKFNPASNSMRPIILANPQKFADKISAFTCNDCGKRINEGERDFKLMKNHILRFITGTVFPTL